MALYRIRLSDGNKEKYFETFSAKPIEYSLYKLDLITSEFQNEEEYIDLCFRETDLFGFKPKKIWIVSKNERKREIIYNDEFLFQVISNALDEKTKKIDVYFIQEYIEKIKNFMLDKEFLESFMSCSYLHQRLKKEMNNYHYLKKCASSSPIIKLNLMKCEEEINKYLCQYEVFREVRRWENVDALEVAYIETQREGFSKPIPNENQGTAEQIKNPYIRELYEKYDGDIGLIAEIVGEDYLEELSEDQQELIGYSNLKRH